MVDTRRRGISRRGVVLVVLLLAVALVLAPFVRNWLEQRSRIEALRADIATREQAVDELKIAEKRWEDPNYVITQARKRFTYVMPGEVGYVVLDTPRTVTDKNDPSSAAARQAAAANGSWVGRMWSSIEIAGAAPADPAGVPDSQDQTEGAAEPDGSGSDQ